MGLDLEFFNSGSKTNVESTKTTQEIENFNVTQAYDQALPVTVSQSQVLEKDEERALLLIDNPEDFENLMINEDLERIRQNSFGVNEDNEENNSGSRTDLQ